MRKDVTELVFILDRSGSMGGLEKDTIGGYNSVLEKQRETEGECIITTVLFDHCCEILHDRTDVRFIRKLTEKDYSVGGCTALLDAMGKTIQKISTAHKNMSEEGRPEKVMVVVITDGEENSSRTYSLKKVRAMIEHHKKKFGWEFVFLGANIDAVATARSFGISADRAAEYVPDEDGVELNFEVMRSAVSEFRHAGRLSKNCLEDIRCDMKKRSKGAGRR